MKELVSEYTEKCFLLRGNLIVSILKMATGKKELEDLTEEDARKLTIIVKAGKETVYYNGVEIGNISCAIEEFKMLYTFTPINAG